MGLESRANRVETVDGVECFLWRTPVHPGNPRHPMLQAFSPPLFELYRRFVPALLRDWAKGATTIIVEAGIGVLLIEDLRRWNPDATIIYIASDDLETIGLDPYLIRVFRRSARLMDGARVPSRLLGAVMPPGLPVRYMPPGIGPDLRAHADPSPYGAGIHVVSVGSMLFDARFFHAAAEAFPNVIFHVIGSGAPKGSLPASVVQYEEMPFVATLPYLKHARAGVAPYRRANVPYYLGDTSMKLLQYEYFGLPAICPNFVVGDNRPLRFGYEPDDPASIKEAITAALGARRGLASLPLEWTDVVDRILDPAPYLDTVMESRHRT